MQQNTLDKKTDAAFDMKNEVPNFYVGVEEEYQAVRTGVGVVNRSKRGKVRMTGKDRTRFLHGMITNTVEGLEEGAGNHAALTTVQGQTLLDLWVHHLGDYLWLETEAGYQTQLYETLDRYLIADDVVMQDETEVWGVLGVVGALALDKVKSTLGLDVEHLKVHHTVEGVWNGTPIWVTHRPFLGVAGFDVRVAVSNGATLWQALIGDGAIPVGKQAQEILRVEAGIPYCGVEIDESVAPLEAGLADTVDFNKGCYIGQEVIAKMHFRGKPRRYLVGVKVQGDQVVDSNTEIKVADKVVGRISSCVYSPKLKAVIALAILKRGMHEVGQDLNVGDRKGEVVALPFVSVGL